MSPPFILHHNSHEARAYDEEIAEKKQLLSK